MKFGISSYTRRPLRHRRNQLDKHDVNIRNKDRPVAQAYNKEEGIYSKEICAMIAHFEEYCLPSRVK